MAKYKMNATYKKEDGSEVEVTSELIMGQKLPLQLREISKWFLSEYGVDKEVEQGELFKALDSHQEDNVVLSRTPAQPISRVMGFYRGRLNDTGLYAVDNERAPRENKIGADGKPTAKNTRKSKRKLAEEAAEAGSITGEQAEGFQEGQPVDPEAAQVM